MPGQDADGHPRLHVVAYDCGEKKGIAKRLSAAGCEVTVVPWDTPAEKVLEMNPTACSSQRPRRPVSVPPVVDAVRVCLGKLPIFGICLGTRSSPWRLAPRSRSSRRPPMAATSP